MIITNKEKHIIERLANNGYVCPLIAFGADMYRKGMIKGAVVGVTGTVIGLSIMRCIEIINNESKNVEES